MYIEVYDRIYMPHPKLPYNFKAECVIKPSMKTEWMTAACDAGINGCKKCI